MAEPDPDFEISHGNTKFRARGYDFISVLLSVGLTIALGILYQHMMDTHIANDRIAKALIMMTREQVKTNCILALPQESRLDQITSENALCKRLADQIRE